MGFEIARFPGHVDEELMCPICGGVLEEPVQVDSCEHAFCRRCIEEWLSHNQSCPVDREMLTRQQLVPVPRILRNMLSRLVILCDNQNHGCQVSVQLELLPAHLNTCENNPSRPVTCLQGCGLQVPQNQLADHSCIKALRTMLDEQLTRVQDLERRSTEQQLQLHDQQRDLRRLQETLAGLCGSTCNSTVSPSTSASTPDSHSHSVTTDELQIWSHSLPRAKVTRWGGMISTPDAVLQSAIRRSLLDCGCPFLAVGELMDRAHERQWPAGLQCLEVRQNNRVQYQRYVCRRVPNRQAVVILASDNRHMPSDLIVEPGIVMIFAHGVE